MFAGQLEKDRRNADDVRKLRLERLRQVREQERAIASGHAQLYKDCIGNRKRVREDLLREKLVRDERSLQRSLALHWQRSLIDTGYAHRTANHHKNSRSMDARREDAVEAQRSAVVAQRGKDALNEFRNQRATSARAATEAADRRFQNVKETSFVDREEARSAAEARAATVIARSIIMQSAMSSSLSSSSASAAAAAVTQNKQRVRQGALKVQDRGNVTLRVQARVFRHGSGGNDGFFDEQEPFTIVNDVGLAEQEASRKRFGQVLRELVHRKVSTVRAYVAKKATRRRPTDPQHDAFEADLALLSSVDKAAARSAKRRSSGADVSVISRGTTTAAEMESLRDFEGEFFGNVSTGGEDFASPPVAQPTPPAWVIPSGIPQRGASTKRASPVNDATEKPRTAPVSSSTVPQLPPPAWQDVAVDASILSVSTSHVGTDDATLTVSMRVKGEESKEVSFQAFFQDEEDVEEGGDGVEEDGKGDKEGTKEVAAAAAAAPLPSAAGPDDKRATDDDVSEVITPFAKAKLEE